MREYAWDDDGLIENTLGMESVLDRLTLCFTPSSLVVFENRFLDLPGVRRLVPPQAEALAESERARGAAECLLHYCEEFRRLLDEHGDSEEAIHTWLNEKRHHVFLDIAGTDIRSKMQFGKKVSDFVVRRSDNTYVLVEIEAATANIFRRDNSEPSARFAHACTQVRDWQRYIRNNVYNVRHELGLDSIYEPRGMVVIGRTRQIEGHEAGVRWQDLKNNFDLEVFTYDELCWRVEALARRLTNLEES